MNSLDAIHSFESKLEKATGHEFRLTYNGIIWDSVIEEFDEDGCIDHAMQQNWVNEIAGNFKEMTHADFFGFYNGDLELVIN
jgi:hypothetical protein